MKAKVNISSSILRIIFGVVMLIFSVALIHISLISAILLLGYIAVIWVILSFVWLILTIEDYIQAKTKSYLDSIQDNYISWLNKRIDTTTEEKQNANDLEVYMGKVEKLCTYKECLNYFLEHNKS